MIDQSTTQPVVTPQTTEPSTDAAAKPVVPETYSFKAPDGKELDAKFIDRATPIFKELGLDNAAAQRLVDTYNELATGQADLAIEAVNRMRGEWVTTLKSEFGTAGLEKMTADIGKMKDAVYATDPKGREAFEKAMNLTGAGDNPDIVKAFHKMASKWTEGAHVSGGGPSAQGQRQPDAPPPSAAQRMYPNLKSANAA